MDPLSDVLALLKPRSYLSAGFDAGGEWAIHFPKNAGIKCYAVVSGACWLYVEGVAEAVHLQAGDCFLLPRGWPFRLASDLALPSVEAATVFSATRVHGVVTYNGGGDFFLVGSRFVLDGAHATLLLAMLPPIVHIHNVTDQMALRWSVERMMHELHDKQPGSYLIAQHLAHMMLVQALRLHMVAGASDGTGWLFALADKKLGTAISAMHASPAQQWTLQTLAQTAGMSRSSFALKFKEKVGASPMEYLTRWRMMLASERLVNGNEAIAVIALSLGYESESAFSTAFKRVMGRSPRQYGKGDETTSPDMQVDDVSHSSLGELIALEAESLVS
ncbi:AraC family transcriptional regulator [Undibacterium sp. Ji83W]|uniref:AraC family transcriptional regulator n=1 Tax=Undibacterium sp. Ji83W TaxID=3413043 RepID=UPI003BF17B3C